MRNQSADVQLTIAYSLTEHGSTMAIIAALPGTRRTGRTREEAREQILKALTAVLSTPFPEVVAEAGSLERVRVRLEFARDPERSVGR